MLSILLDNWAGRFEIWLFNTFIYYSMQRNHCQPTHTHHADEFTTANINGLVSFFFARYIRWSALILLHFHEIVCATFDFPFQNTMKNVSSDVCTWLKLSFARMFPKGALVNLNSVYLGCVVWLLLLLILDFNVVFSIRSLCSIDYYYVLGAFLLPCTDLSYIYWHWRYTEIFLLARITLHAWNTYIYVDLHFCSIRFVGVRGIH